MLWLSALLLAVERVAAPAAAPAAPLAVKVLVINMFGLEAAPWLTALHTDREIRVPGLSSDYPLVRCNADAVCQMTTGMGHANAAASMMAVLYSGLFDLRRDLFSDRRHRRHRSRPRHHRFGSLGALRRRRGHRARDRCA